MARCIFFDSAAQAILYQKPTKSYTIALYIDQKGWFIQLNVKELNKWKAIDTTATLISPFSYLFLRYRASMQERALFILILQEHCYLVTFAKNRPQFWKIYKIKENVDIAKCIEDFLKRFYEKPESYFVEKIYIYNLNKLVTPKSGELEERLLLPITVENSSIEKACESAKGAAIDLRSLSGSFWRRHKMLLMVGIASLLVAGVYEGYLRYMIDSYEKKLAKLVKRQVAIANQNNSYQSHLMRFKKFWPIIEELKQHNAFLASRIRSLFDLIPDDAYLTKAEIGKNALLFEGVCRSKEHLLRSLHYKLAKNFQKKRITFTKTKDGFLFQALYEEIIDEKS